MTAPVHISMAVCYCSFSFSSSHSGGQEKRHSKQNADEKMANLSIYEYINAFVRFTGLNSH